MRAFNLLFFFGAILLLTFCKSVKTDSNEGILKGTVGLFEGNCMPAPGKAPCKPSPISTTVYVTTPSEKYLSENLVDSIVSKADGTFSISLMKGDYSLFLRDGPSVVCPGVECPSECICAPISIEAGDVTEKTANLDHASW